MLLRLEGLRALADGKTLSHARLALGEAPPPPPSKEQLAAQEWAKAQAAKAKAKAKAIADAAKDKAAAEAKAAGKKPAKDLPPIGEACEEPPEFDMQDIPTAMDAMGWPVSARFARRWFNGLAYIISDKNKASGHPMDTSITLNWAMKFGSVKRRYKELIENHIYNINAIKELKAKIEVRLKESFKNGPYGLHFNTASFVNNLHQFHEDWQFQFISVGSQYTASNYIVPTDLTGALANFNIYAAIGNVVVFGPKYFLYDNQKNTKTWCMEPTIQITHIYVYIRDAYEFNAKPGERKSQYLGHWNKTGMIVTTLGLISDLDRAKVNKSTEHFGNFPVSRNIIGATEPVDIRRPLRKLRPEDVFWPVFNSDYTKWRKLHGHGEDFVVFTKPVLVKLKKPIEFTMEKPCSLPQKM
jgi:hypothetical protein